MVVAVNQNNFFAVTTLRGKEVEVGEQGPMFRWQEKRGGPENR
jgi:hypothetical protein